MQDGWQKVEWPEVDFFPLQFQNVINIWSPNYKSPYDQGERGASGLDGRPGVDGKLGAAGPPGQRVFQFLPTFHQT